MSRTLTGGTGDVNPQWLTINATQSSADALTTQSFPIPIQRLPTGRSGARAQVLELLKVHVYAPASVEVDNAIVASLTTRNPGESSTIAASNTGVILRWRRQVYLTTSGQVETKEPDQYDFSDSAGHGTLIAVDTIYMQISSTSTSVANEVTMKLLYRWKNVSIQEYVGIVQSQQ